MARRSQDDRALLREQCELAEALRRWYARAGRLSSEDPRKFADTLVARLEEKRRLERRLREVELARRVVRADLRARLDRAALVQRLARLLEVEE